MTTTTVITDDSLSPRRSPGRLGWLLMLPLLAWLTVFVIAPTAILFAYSFGQRDEVGQVQFRLMGPVDPKVPDGPQRLVIFDQYLRIFDPAYLGAIAWAAGYMVVGAAMGAGLLVAYWQFSGRFGPRRVAIVRGLFWGAVFGFFIGFDRNIGNVDVSGNFLLTLWQSVKYAAYTTVICIALGYPVAYFIGRASPVARNWLLMLVMIPFWTSFLIRTYAWITILKGQGLLNNAIDFTGVSHLLMRLAQFEGLQKWLAYNDQPYVTADGHLDLLYRPAATMIGLVYTYLPFMILPIYGSVEKLDNAMVEAAFDLGAGPVRAFQHVIIPLTRPGIVAGCMLVFIPAIGMFAIQEMMGGGRLPNIGTVIRNQFIGQARNTPFGSALGITLVALFVLVFWLTGRKQEK